jgi:hypothetical protein
MNAQEKKRVEKWLELNESEKEENCPFLFGEKSRCHLCAEIFPRTREIIKKGRYFYERCPCFNYSLNYVTRKAKEVLNKEN